MTDLDDILTKAAQHVEVSAHALRRLARLLRVNARSVEDHAVIAFLESEARRVEQLQHGAIEIEHRGDQLWRFTSRRVDDDDFWRGEHTASYQKAKTAASSDDHVAGSISNLTTRRATYPAAPRAVDAFGTEGTPTLVDALCAPGTRIEIAGLRYDTARMQNDRARKAFYRAPKRVAEAVDHVRVGKVGSVIWASFSPPDRWDTTFVRRKRVRPNATERDFPKAASH